MSVEKPQVKTVTAAVHEINDICDKAKDKIFAKVLAHYHKNPGSAWSGHYLVELESTLKSMYAELGVDVGTAFKKTLPKTMREFYDAAAKEMKTAGKNKGILGAPDQKRINYFLNNTFEQIAMRTTRMSFDHVKQLRSISAEVLRTASITGDSRQKVTKDMLERAMQIPGFKFTAKNGAVWSDKAYFTMLARTELMNAGRASHDDKCASEGYDVMMLDYSGNCCEACGKFEGQIFSLSGATPGIPTKADLEAAGVFHPNCTHTYSAVTDFELAEKGLEIRNPGTEDAPLAETAPADMDAKDAADKVEEIEAKRAEFPDSLDDLKHVQALGGSTGAELVEDKDGNRFVLKHGGTAGGDAAAHLRNEAAADNFYRAAGINVPENRLYETENGPVKLSKFVDGGTSLSDYWQNADKKEREILVEKLRPGFDADVLLGNWDVVGMGADNILIDKDGTPWRIDNGGALGFRAQGMAKNPEQWRDGWPDDLWSMRTSANNSPFFGGINTYDLCKSISENDWTDAMAGLPEADKAVIEKRIAEIKQLSARGKDFKDSGYTPDALETSIRAGYDLSKDGIREQFDDRKVEFSGTMPSDFGFFRSPNPTSTQQYFGQKKDDDVQAKVVAAAKTVCLHNGASTGKAGSGDHTPNAATLKAAYDLKPELEKLADKGNDGATYYLRKIEQIEAAAQNGTTLQGKLIDSSIPIYERAKQNTGGKKEPESFTAAVFEHIKNQTVEYNGKKIPLDPLFITQAQSDQGNDSFYRKACNMKIARLNALGIKPEEAESKGWFCGALIGQKKHWDIAVQYYKDNPDMLKRDTETYIRYQAACSVALENCNIPGNDPATRTFLLARTEHDDVMAKSKEGHEMKASHGACESFSAFETVVVHGHHLTMCRVPYSRISGMYLAESEPGSRCTGFLGDGENEISADTRGLHTLYIKSVNRSHEDLEPYREQYRKWEKNGFK